jgi:MFS superfamily sulfate permease-like transporter
MKNKFISLDKPQIADIIAGFSVFLLALPLSLGIAKASEFPPIMGLWTAAVGGLIVGPIMGSKLSIKGPAAGLIVIVAGCVTEFGGGDLGWKMALGVIAVAGLIQILFGLLNFGKYVTFFPLSAVHGMLAAIGIIILSKQIPVLLNVDPALTKGLGPLELIAKLPVWLSLANLKAVAIGLPCLLFLLFYSKLPAAIKKIPAPIYVLAFSIPMALYLQLGTTNTYAMVKMENIVDKLDFNISFGGVSQIVLFIKYVVMFALVGSIESLLTVSAVDMMTPDQPKADTNKDLKALGFGNIISSVFGGLPMISEVARSTANVNAGAKSAWANIFHGALILIFSIFFVSYLELIPNTALAAMLIAVGFKLAHPREFKSTWQVGPEQLIIFLVTIFVTLYEDLLLGILAGIVTKFIIHLFNGASLKSLFSLDFHIENNENERLYKVEKSLSFSNLLKLKEDLEHTDHSQKAVVDLSSTNLVDHTCIECLYHLKEDFKSHGGHLEIVGLEDHRPLSKHKYASRVKKMAR